MDVLLLNSSVYDIPSTRRVGAIVYDGAADLQLWPGPGTDRDLAEAWGDGVQEALDTQLRASGKSALDIGECARVHRGKLHCDFLCWVASRAPEPGETRSPVPDAAALEKVVASALEFVAQKDVVRVAFPSLGAGPGEVDAAERLAIVVRGARAYEERCYASGRPQTIEEVIVCDANGKILETARKKVAALAKSATVPRPEPDAIAAPKAKRASAAKSTSSGGRRAPKGPPRIDPDEAAMRRPMSHPYDRSRRYGTGEWLLHAKFGVGRIDEVTPEGAIVVMFEDGEQRKMLAGR
jgi:O-acetyl-ADP-ribose deacetylase (regulator of RNase III)